MDRKSRERVATLVRPTRQDAESALAEVDWAAIDALTDDEIARQIAENADAAPDMGEWPGKGWIVSKGGMDVRAIRRGLGLTQEDFATRLGVPLGTLRNWEQGRSRPTGAAAALLRLVARIGPPAIAALRRTG